MCKLSMCLLQNGREYLTGTHYYASVLHQAHRWLRTITYMKTTIAILTAWVILIGIADYNRQAPTQEEITNKCVQVDLGDGSFVCQ